MSHVLLKTSVTYPDFLKKFLPDQQKATFQSLWKSTREQHILLESLVQEEAFYIQLVFRPNGEVKLALERHSELVNKSAFNQACTELIAWFQSLDSHCEIKKQTLGKHVLFSETAAKES